MDTFRLQGINKDGNVDNEIEFTLKDLNNLQIINVDPMSIMISRLIEKNNEQKNIYEE